MAIPRFLLPTLLALICGGGAFAADPLTFPWQGRLTVNEIPLTGSHTMVFSLLDSSSTELYNSGSISVQVTEGLAAVLVGGGSMPAIAASVANADGLKMHILLDGTPLSTDIPLVPAFRAHAISDGVVSEAKLDTAAAVKLNALATALSTSTTLGGGAASDTKVPSQLAVKTYVDNAVANGGGGGGGGGATIDTSVTLGSSNAVVPSQLAVKTYVDNGNATLATSVTSEATTRANFDTALNTAITNEASARTTAVAAKLDASALDTATTLGAGAASNAKVPSQLAVKTYVDAAVAGGGVAPDTSTTLGGGSASNTVISSQLAVKTYVDAETTARTSADTTLTSAVAAKLDSSALDTTTTLGAGAASNAKVPSQLAVKTYVDAAVAGGGVAPDTSTTLGGGSASNTVISSQLAVKTYVDAETTARTSAVSAEATSRTNADNTLTTAVAAKLDASALDTTADLGTSGTPSNAKVPSQLAVKTYVDTAVAAVSGTTIADGSVSTQKLADGAVTSVKIANGAVTLAKQANIADGTILGNNTGSAAAPVALDATHVKAVLAIGASDVSGLATVATSGAIADLSGTVATAQIADGAVTLAKQATIPDATILGNNTGGGTAHAPIALTVGQLKTLLAIGTADVGGGLAAIATSGSTSDLSGTIATAQIADANVTTAKIADAGVTTAKIADANITAAKMATDSVVTAKILDANVTAAKLADTSVTTAKIADGAVTAAKMGLATEGRLTWTSIVADPSPAAANTGYVVTVSSGVTLPEAALGDRIRIYAMPGQTVNVLASAGAGDIIDINGSAVNPILPVPHFMELLCVDPTPGTVIWAVITSN